MTRLEIEQAVKAGIVAASGKSLSQAVQVISDSLEAHMAAEPKFVIAEVEAVETPLASKLETPSPIILASQIERLHELAPIAAAGAAPVKSTTFREYHSAPSLQQALESAPEILAVLPSGFSEPLELRRIITTMATDPVGVQLAYKVPGADPDVSFPKEFFWATDEHIDVAKALVKIRADAELMYARRTKPVEMRVVAMAPLETRMNKAGDVVWTTEKGQNS